MTDALINPEVLSWARQRATLSEIVLARKMGTREERIKEWEEGTRKPTFIQAQKLARVTHVPFGYLFLPAPPRENIRIPDLRTIEGRGVNDPSPELQDIVKQALYKQSWFKEYLISQGERPLDFVGSVQVGDNIAEVVAKVRSTLGINQPSKGTWEEYNRDIIQGAENARILVMRSGIVGNDTHRKLDVKEFRGFAISDQMAPVVFINSADAPTARLFTLVHELAHLWIGSSGISDGEPHNQAEEVYCNAIAGEFLVPEKFLLNMWNRNCELIENLTELASKFHVSKLVVGRRARDLFLITGDEYNAFYQNELATFKAKDGGGGNFYKNAGAKNSTQLSKAVITEALSGRLLLRDAGRLLGIAPNKIGRYGRDLGI